MKRNLARHEVEASEGFESHQFSVEFSAEMFSLISDTLYSRPIEAIVRELSCNAFDSHVKAGTESTPFIIKCPTRMNTEFFVQDFGTGLTPKEIKEVYTVVFKSDKTHTNDMTGCFGVGSKSPFSYTHQFAVESVVDGTKWIYSVYLDENRIPCISDLTKGGVETQDPDGVKISFDIKSNDIYSFEQAFKKSLKWFIDHPPTVKGTTIPELTFEQRGDDWGFINNASYYSTHYRNPYAVMGNVAYEIDPNQFDVDLPGSMVMWFELGELTPAASREYLQYDDRTINAISGKYERVIKELAKDAQDAVNQADNLFDARVIVRKLRDASSIGSEIAKTITWNGDKMSWSTSISPSSSGAKLWEYRAGSKRLVYGFPVKENAYLIVHDETYLKNKKTEYLSEQDHSKYYYVASGMSSDEIAEFAENVGLKKGQYLLTSEMSRPPTHQNSANKSSSAQRAGAFWKFDCPSSSYGTKMADYWEKHVDDLADFAYYVKRKANKPFNGDGNLMAGPESLARKVRHLESLGVEVVIYATTESRMDKIPDNWKDFHQAYDEFMSWVEVNTNANYSFILQTFSNDYDFSIIRQISRYKNIDDPRFEEIKLALQEWENGKDGHRMLVKKGRPDYNSYKTSDLRVTAQSIADDYPLLGEVRYAHKVSDELVEYINLKYNQESN